MAKARVTATVEVDLNPENYKARQSPNSYEHQQGLIWITGFTMSEGALRPILSKDQPTAEQMCSIEQVRLQYAYTDFDELIADGTEVEYKVEEVR